jgi:hypothetical protein
MGVKYKAEGTMLNQYHLQGFLNGDLDYYRQFGDYTTTDDTALAEAERSFQFRRASLKPGEKFTLELRRELKVIATFPQLQDLLVKEAARSIAA